MSNTLERDSIYNNLTNRNKLKAINCHEITDSFQLFFYLAFNIAKIVTTEDEALNLFNSLDFIKEETGDLLLIAMNLSGKLDTPIATRIVCKNTTFDNITNT
jgi:hypothetical protein